MSGERDKKAKRSWGGSWSDLGGLDLDGVLVILGLIVAVAAGWAIVELLAPALLLCAYVAIVAGLRRVANDRHGCEGNLPRSILWGALWATVYTVPLGLVVALGQWILAR